MILVGYPGAHMSTTMHSLSGPVHTWYQHASEMIWSQEDSRDTFLSTPVLSWPLVCIWHFFMEVKKPSAQLLHSYIGTGLGQVKRFQDPIKMYRLSHLFKFHHPLFTCALLLIRTWWVNSLRDKQTVSVGQSTAFILRVSFKPSKSKSVHSRIPGLFYFKGLH